MGARRVHPWRVPNSHPAPRRGDRRRSATRTGRGFWAAHRTHPHRGRNVARTGGIVGPRTRRPTHHRTRRGPSIVRTPVTSLIVEVSHGTQATAYYAGSPRRGRPRAG